MCCEGTINAHGLVDAPRSWWWHQSAVQRVDDVIFIYMYVCVCMQKMVRAGAQVWSRTDEPGLMCLYVASSSGRAFRLCDESEGGERMMRLFLSFARLDDGDGWSRDLRPDSLLLSGNLFPK